MMNASSISSSSTRDYGSCLPPGYRFIPSDDELLIHLHHKINHGVALMPHIRDVHLYDSHPQTLAETYPPVGDNEWYFFTPRNRKHPNGSRPDRAAAGGFWKAVITDKKVKHEGRTIGHKKTLVYHSGKPKEAVRTSWIMHEYRADYPPRTRTHANDTTLDEWVLCRVYEKASKLKGNRQDVVDHNSEAAVVEEINTQTDDQTTYKNINVVDPAAAAAAAAGLMEQFYNINGGGDSGYLIHGGDLWTEINPQEFPSDLLHQTIDHNINVNQQFYNIGNDASVSAGMDLSTPIHQQDFPSSSSDHNNVNAATTAGVDEQLCNGSDATVRRDEEEMGEYMRMLTSPDSPPPLDHLLPPSDNIPVSDNYAYDFGFPIF